MFPVVKETNTENIDKVPSKLFLRRKAVLRIRIHWIRKILASKRQNLTKKTFFIC